MPLVACFASHDPINIFVSARWFMSRRLYCLFIAVGFILAFLSPRALAKKAKNKSGDFLQVTSVDSTGNTITVADNNGKNATTYAVTSVTVILVNEQPAKLADLKKGMHIDVSLIEGGKAVSKIDASSATPPKKKAS